MVEMALARWTRRSPWADVVAPGRIGPGGAPGVTIEALQGLGLAMLIVADEGSPALAGAIAERLGIALPETPLIRRAGAFAAAWAGPDRWMLVADDRDALRSACAELDALAAVSEQSDGWAALRVSGPAVRRALAKGFMIDLHASAFGDGAVALTAVAHINVAIWREAEAFTILVPRSMAGSFWSWLSASAAEFGCDVRG
jgi:methylglutamate dehydrogenase subunit D